MHQHAKSKAPDTPTSPTRRQDDRSSSSAAMKARGGRRKSHGTCSSDTTVATHSSKRTTRKPGDSVSPPKTSPSSAGAAPSLSLNGIAVRGTGRPPALLTAGGRLMKRNSPFDTGTAGGQKPSPRSAVSATASAVATPGETPPSSARVRFLKMNAVAALTAPTPRKAVATSRRAAPATVDSVPDAGKPGVGGGGPPSCQPSLSQGFSSHKAIDDAPALQLHGRTVPGAACLINTVPSPSTPSSASGGDAVATQRGGLPGSALAMSLPPLVTGAGGSLGASFSSAAAASAGVSTMFVASASTPLPSGSVGAVKRPMTLLERRSGRERNAMSLSCLSALSVETIQETSRNVGPIDAQPEMPILRGWSRTVASADATQHLFGRFSNVDLLSPCGVAGHADTSSMGPCAAAASPQSRGWRSSPALPPSALGRECGPFGFAGGGEADMASPLMPRSTFLRLSSLRGAVKMVSYNLLADRLVSTDRYPSCPPVALGEDYRTQLMKKELQHVQADILVFAEMSVDMFEKPNLLGDFLRTSMNCEGNHVVITDQQGRPLCAPRKALSSTEMRTPPARRGTVPALPALSVAPRSPSTPTVSASATTSSMTGSATMAPVRPTSSPTQLQLSRHTSRFGSNMSLKREAAPSSAPGASSCTGAAATSESSAETPCSRWEKVPPHGESPIRRTEMEGVAVFYNKDRFDLLECVPIRFNEIACADAKLTPYERKKLQAKSHNVALVSALRDRTFPSHVYLVAAVHIIWQRVESQLWQSRALMQTMEELKAKYDVQWREGKRTRPPSFASTPAKEAKYEGSGHSVPSAAKREEETPSTLVKVEPTATPEEPVSAAAAADDAPEQRAICIVAGDFNADRTNPLLCYLCEGYVPAESPVMSYWRHAHGAEGDLGPARHGSANSGEGPTDRVEDGCTDESCSTTVVATSAATVPSPSDAARRRSTETVCGDERDGAKLAVAHRASADGPSTGSGAAERSTRHPPADRDACDGSSGGDGAVLPTPSAPTQPPQPHPQRRLFIAPAAGTAEGEAPSSSPLWLSADACFASPPTLPEQGGSATDDLNLSPATEHSPSPVRDNWCGPQSEPGKGTRRRVSFAEGSASDTHPAGAGLLSSLLMAEDLSGDDDAPPPPPPAARKRKVFRCNPTAPNPAHVNSPLSSDNRRERPKNDAPPCTDAAAEMAPTTPGKTATAKRRVPLSLLTLDTSLMSGVEISGRLDIMNHSTATSDAASSVLSNAMDGEHSLGVPPQYFFTPESLGSIFHEATARAEVGVTAAVSGHSQHHITHSNADLGEVGAEDSNSLATTAFINPAAAGAGAAAGSSTASSQSVSSASLNEECEGVAPLQHGVAGDLGSSDGASATSALWHSRAPPALTALRGTEEHMIHPARDGAATTGVTHQLRLHDAYDVYCRRHPHRVSAVNPSSNQEGKVLDHVLYEPEHVACASVLRLGERIELPTRNIPSDHYMIGVLLIPRASLALPPPR